MLNAGAIVTAVHRGASVGVHPCAVTSRSGTEVLARKNVVL